MDLNPNQVEFLMKKFHKGCVICHTNNHEIVMCPVIKDKLSITTKRTNNRNKTTRTTPSGNGSARTTLATIPEEEDKDNNGTTNEMNEVEQGKSCHSISSTAPKIMSLLPSATSAQNLTPLFIPSQDNLLVDELEHDDDIDQRVSFQQETLPGPTDPSISIAMCFRQRDTSNTSNIVLARTAQTSFVGSTGFCMGRARLVSPHKSIKHGYACVDSGATHHMSNGEATDFMNYKTLPKGSHVLVADNHPTKCLGIGTQFLQINDRIIGRQQVLHVPALKAPLISVRQHRRIYKTEIKDVPSSLTTTVAT
jgi:hypothetical protein